jgi:hypothetical protein
MSNSSEAYKRQLQGQIDTAKGQVALHTRRLADSTDEGQKVILRGTLEGAKSTLANLESSLRNA